MHNATKITPEHLRRLAYLYVRQSSLHQVQEHGESTARQYALKRRAEVLGWSSQHILIIDEDLGLSGASTAAPQSLRGRPELRWLPEGRRHPILQCPLLPQRCTEPSLPPW